MITDDAAQNDLNMFNTINSKSIESVLQNDRQIQNKTSQSDYYNNLPASMSMKDSVNKKCESVKASTGNFPQKLNSPRIKSAND